MMPDPNGDEHARSGERPPTLHLSCRCQRTADDALSLCGMVIDHDAPSARHDVDVATYTPDAVPLCVVCADLAERALILSRCERCPR
jgi:hypothetical protein